MNILLSNTISEMNSYQIDFIEKLSSSLGSNAHCILPGEHSEEKFPYWQVNTVDKFLKKENLIEYWNKDSKHLMINAPQLVLPNSILPSRVSNILLAYSSYPDAEETFLRVGMDMALRLGAHLHCLKIVKPPHVLWTKKQYPITNQLKCIERIITHESISQGVLEYAVENNIDLIALLTRPWDNPKKDMKNSHSMKVLSSSRVPVLLYREDTIQSLPHRKWA